MISRRIKIATLLITVLAVLAGPGLALAAGRASFTDIESDVMCVLCHEPLAVAQSPEAFQERDVIRGLILQGETKQQILHSLVEQYGPAVLARPPAKGFNLSVYIIPPTVLVLGIITVAITLPRWRRRTREAARNAPGAITPTMSDDDTRRLDEDLARSV